jgi:hypothetical protein
MNTAPTTIPEAVAAVLAMLFQFGPPSTWAGVDPDSEKIVAYGLAATVPRLCDLVGDDTARRDEAKRLVQEGVTKHSTHTFDVGQGERLCRAVHRAWMAATIQRHPRADRFGTLVEALRRGRYSEAQRALALRLIAEVA